MSNLFQLSNNLQQIYAEIEENEGELTPEIEEALIIGEDQFKSKLNDYANLIKSLKADVEQCSLETKRINEYKKRKEKLIEKLSNIVSEAVYKFGTTTKSGGANIDLGTQKITVRCTDKVEVCDEAIEQFSEDMNKFIHNMQENRLIDNVEFTQDFLDSEAGAGMSVDDLANIKFNITFQGNVLELTEGRKSELLKLMYELTNGLITYNVSKTDCKSAINDGKFLSFATLKPNKTITIK